MKRTSRYRSIVSSITAKRISALRTSHALCGSLLPSHPGSVAATPWIWVARGASRVRAGQGIRPGHGYRFLARFILIALQLKEKGVAHYGLVEEGEVVSYHEARLSELGLDQVADRVEFFQGDATNLKPQFTGYDLILAANLIDRLNDPREFLETVHERLNPGGVLVITSPYTWLEEFTKKENWLGGIRKAGEPYLTLDTLATC